MTESEFERTHAKRTPAKSAVAFFLVIGILVVFVLTAAVMIGNKRKKAAEAANAGSSPAPVVTVGVTRAAYRDLPNDLTVTGSISAVDPLQVGSEINGLRVETINVEEGDFVQKGQVLAHLNSSILEAQLAQAQARYDSSQSQVSKAIQPNRPQDIAGLRSALSQAQANESQQKALLAQARTNLKHAQETSDRYSQVLAQGFVTAQEASDRATEAERMRQLVFAAESQLQAATWAVEQARQRLDLAQAGGRTEDVNIARSSSQEIAGMIQQLTAQLEQTYIRAPDDGVVIQRDIHLGEISSAGKSFFTLARKGQLELRAQVPQDDLTRLKVADRARVAVGDRTVGGKIWMISPKVDPSNRLGTVRILLDHERGVMSGMFARANLSLGIEKALVVPITAVLGEEGDRYVFVVTGDRAHKKSVKTGLRTKQVVEILEGIEPNDQVIISGGGFLADGDQVSLGAAPASEGQPSKD